MHEYSKFSKRESDFVVVIFPSEGILIQLSSILIIDLSDCVAFVRFRLPPTNRYLESSSLICLKTSLYVTYTYTYIHIHMYIYMYKYIHIIQLSFLTTEMLSLS